MASPTTQPYTDSIPASDAPAKPLPSLPLPPAYQYTDSPAHRHAVPLSQTPIASPQLYHNTNTTYIQIPDSLDSDDLDLIPPYSPYHDLPTPSNPNSISLTHYPHPLDLPPSYAIAVRQSFRDTLRPHIHIPRWDEERARSVSRDSRASSAARWMLEDDEEGRDAEEQYDVEKVVAMFVVAVALLVVSGVLAWLVVLG